MKIAYGQELVDELRRQADNVKKRIWIAVPYIGGLKSVRRIIGSKWTEDERLSIRLLTDTNEFSNLNSETIRTFNELGELKHLVGIHAKIYIIDNLCLITSANLTNTAFTKRHEIGVFLDKADSLKAISIFNNWWDKAEKISSIVIKKMKRVDSESSEDALGQHLQTLWSLPDNDEPENYWLKPIGATDQPIDSERKFTQKVDYLHFSKKQPKSVKPNDILITYGIGDKRILSVFKCLSSPEKVTEEEIERKPRLERWPWYVRGKNLTPLYGGKWMRYTLYASRLVNDYLTKYPDRYITKVGGKNLNALMYSIDKINLEPDFAKFVIKKVMNRNR